MFKYKPPNSKQAHTNFAAAHTKWEEYVQHHINGQQNQRLGQVYTKSHLTITELTTKYEIQTYNEEFHIKPILDVIREGKFRWLGHVLRREPHSMLHEVVNYKVKGKGPRGRPRTTWLKSMDNLLKEKGSTAA